MNDLTAAAEEFARQLHAFKSEGLPEAEVEVQVQTDAEELRALLADAYPALADKE